MMDPVEPECAYAPQGHVHRFRVPPVAEEASDWDEIYIEGTTFVPVRGTEPVSPSIEIAGMMDGALSGSDSDTIGTLAATLMTSATCSPTVSTSETLVDLDEQRAHAKYSSLYGEKKQWLKARTAVYVGTLAARTHTLCTYYKAILWSLLLMLPVILVGYAQNLVVSLLAQPQFEERFSGAEDDFGAVWMLAVQMCSVGSSMLGGLLVG
ncbi:hypothetical protein Sste5344_003591 [Sporothrix stenoceras]